MPAVENKARRPRCRGRAEIPRHPRGTETKRLRGTEMIRPRGVTDAALQRGAEN
jgi:hypothetical protein